MSRSKRDFTLREKKYAKTKIAIMREFMSKLKAMRFADISIKEVCETVEVSEGTFYNYFPRKIDIIEYYFALAFLRIIWAIEIKKIAISYQEKIEYIFDAMSDEITEPFLFYEIISVKTSAKKDCHNNLDLTEAEKVLGVPDCDGIECVQSVTMERYFTRILKDAKKDNQLKINFSVDQVVMALMSTAIGVPLSIEIKDFRNLKKAYRAQLAIITEGLDFKKRK